MSQDQKIECPVCGKVVAVSSERLDRLRLEKHVDAGEPCSGAFKDIECCAACDTYVFASEMKRVCESCQRLPECWLGSALDPHQRAALTGYSHRTVRALAHLREAWCIADAGNQPGIATAIRAILGTRSIREMTGIAVAVLSWGLDAGRANELLHDVDPSGALGRCDEGR